VSEREEVGDSGGKGQWAKKGFSGRLPTLWVRRNKSLGIGIYKQGAKDRTHFKDERGEQGKDAVRKGLTVCRSYRKETVRDNTETCGR